MSLALVLDTTIDPANDLGPPPQSLHGHVTEAERLKDKLHDILANDRPMLERNGMDHDAEHLAGWGEKYLKALSSGMIYDGEADSSAWFAGVIDRLQMEVYEMDSLGSRGVHDDDPHPQTNKFIASALAVSNSVDGTKNILD